MSTQSAALSTGSNRKRPLSPSADPSPPTDTPAESPLVASVPVFQHECETLPHSSSNSGSGGDFTITWLTNDAVQTREPTQLDDRITLQSQTTVALIEAVRDTILVVQGRGYIENVTDSSTVVSSIVEIHGAALEPIRTLLPRQDHAKGGNDTPRGIQTHGRLRLLPFESSSWSSWITIPLGAGCRLRIYSDSDDVRHFAAHDTSHEHPLPSFVVHAGTDPEARPTTIPESWRVAVEAVIDDHGNLVASGRAQVPSLYAQTSLFFKASMDDSDPDENDDSPHDSPVRSNNGACADPEVDDTNTGTTRIDDTKDGFQIVVCGAKGVGKSTCLRYCLNRLLTSRRNHDACHVDPIPFAPSVAFLDADPGQPEYCAPGMMQLTLVSSPTLLPPHRHLQSFPPSQQPTNGDGTHSCHYYRMVQAHYFGSVTSSMDPLTYLRIVSSLVQAYKEHVVLSRRPGIPSPPLVVNLDGWIKDLGFDILTTLLQETLQPSHVIQIAGDSLSKTLDLSACLGVQNGIGINGCRFHSCWAFNSTRSKISVPFIGKKQNGTKEHSLVTAQQPDRDSTPNNTVSTASLVTQTPSIPATALRAVRLITYFMAPATLTNESSRTSVNLPLKTLWDRIHVGGKGLDDPDCEIALTMAAVRPVVVSLDNVTIRFTASDTHRDIATESRLLDAVNGSVVGLCCGDVQSDRRSNGTNGASAIDAALLPCVGLGVVRSIDRDRRLLYILTPCDEGVLQSRRVNCLTVGSNVHLPLECYFRGVVSEAFPFVAFDDNTDVQGDDGSFDVLGADPMKSRNTIGRRGQGGG